MNVVNGLWLIEDGDVSTCKACTLEKTAQAGTPRKAKHSKANILEVIHSDLCGPMEEKLQAGAISFEIFIEEPSQ